MKRGGQPGNNNAAKGKLFTDALVKFAKQNPDKRDRVIAKIYDMALDGNMMAIKEIIDRVEGKPKQSIEAEVDQSITVVVNKMISEGE